ncbi:response regulator [Candidatus Kaiserbacteria bacterium]|nr:response regulator [Candidatus Kaiserbacteria bacterium]
MAVNFLLINGSSDNHWEELLQRALGPLGKLSVIRASNGIVQLYEKYDVAIVDATVVEEVEFLVSRLRTKQPTCRIVVVTASPTWQRARTAFEAGAIDYIPKSLGQDELKKTFQEILQKPLPPWPR